MKSEGWRCQWDETDNAGESGASPECWQVLLRLSLFAQKGEIDENLECSESWEGALNSSVGLAGGQAEPSWELCVFPGGFTLNQVQKSQRSSTFKYERQKPSAT